MNRVLVISRDEETVRVIRDVVASVFEVETADTTRRALQFHKNNPADLVFVDLRGVQGASGRTDLADTMTALQRTDAMVQVFVLTPKSAVQDAIRAVKAGASKYFTYPLDPEAIGLEVAAHREARARDHELAYLRDHFWKTEWLDVIHTRNPRMTAIFETIRSVAPTIANVLLLGETGTGKGLLARLIHLHSRRNDKPFLSVHCGAIPDTLLESELFGHEKGAFTGAVRKKIGKFEMAAGGTIFLDEIGTVSASAQVKLLQVLQDKTFSRVGAEELQQADVRVIAATNAYLKELVDQGAFRKDLYYRLNVFPIEIPRLCQRREDIPHLVDVFINSLNQKYGKGIRGLEPEVLAALKTYAWPGNIRELENVLERAYILETGSVLGPQGFPADIILPDAGSSFLGEARPLPLSDARRLAIEALERAYVKDLLARNKGKIALSAAEAGITSRQLNRLMSRYEIKRSDYKT